MGAKALSLKQIKEFRETNPDKREADNKLRLVVSLKPGQELHQLPT